MSARVVGRDPQLRGAVTEHSVEQALTRTIAVRATENGPLIPDDAVFLRVARTGPAYAFHFSHDAQSWHFVRLLRVNAAPSTVSVGFLAQAPLGDGATAVFDEITYSRHSLTDLRHLS